MALKPPWRGISRIPGWAYGTDNWAYGTDASTGGRRKKTFKITTTTKTKARTYNGTYVHIWDGQLGIWDGWAVLHFTVGRMPLGGRRKKTFEITTTTKTTKTKARTKTTSFSTRLFFFVFAYNCSDSLIYPCVLRNRKLELFCVKSSLDSSPSV